MLIILDFILYFLFDYENQPFNFTEKIKPIQTNSVVELQYVFSYAAASRFMHIECTVRIIYYFESYLDRYFILACQICEELFSLPHHF